MLCAKRQDYLIVKNEGIILFLERSCKISQIVNIQERTS